MSDVMRLAPTRASARESSMRDLVLSTGSFDPDVWHVMDQRDNALIADEVLNGAGSSKFVYKFNLAGTNVEGISVVGARHLASHYGGIKHRLIASVSKTGALFTYTSYPHEGSSMSMSAATVPELADEPDFYQVVIEVSDVKRGNAVQVERRESRWEARRDGSLYERPNFATIAQSKAYRNGVLAMIPQDVQIQWRVLQSKLGKDEVITGSVLEHKRAAIMRFAANKGIEIERRQLDTLMLDQIAGLSEASREGGIESFLRSAEALGLVQRGPAPAAQLKAAAPAARKPAEPQQQVRRDADRQQQPAREAPASVDSSAAGGGSDAPGDLQFEADVFDAYGELVVSADGEPIGFGSPMAFAAEMQRQWTAAGDSVELTSALRAHNQDAWEFAVANSSEAAALLAQAPAPEAAPVSLPVLVEIPKTARGGASVAGYRDALSVRLAAIKDTQELLDFVAANRENIMSLPATGRLQCVEAVQLRCRALGAPPAFFGPPDAPVEQSKPEVDADRARADQMKLDIEVCATESALRVLDLGAVMQTLLARWDRDRPELSAEVRRAAEARLRAVREAAGAASPPPS